jgi:hypothetical protein
MIINIPIILNDEGSIFPETENVILLKVALCITNTTFPHTNSGKNFFTHNKYTFGISGQTLISVSQFLTNRTIRQNYVGSYIMQTDLLLDI